MLSSHFFLQLFIKLFTYSNIEDSRLPGVKILLRGDFLGALNCLFPQLNLIPSGTVYCAEQFEKLVVSHHDLITETNSKVPILDPNFSLFSGMYYYLIDLIINIC